MHDFTRRDFVVAALASGFALAVQPLAAETILTPADGLDAGLVEIPTADGKIPAYRAQPAGKRGLALVLVVQEIFGVHEHIKDVCRRLARLGYLAVAPELYARQGDVARIEDIQTILQTVVAKVPDAQVMADLDACVAWARASGAADGTRLAVTGFCWGGRITWLYSVHNPQLKAGVAWYGRLEGQATTNMPRHPLELARELKVPVLGLYGGADSGIPLDSVERMKAALAQGGSGSQIVVYPEAPHAFHADYRPSYRKDAAGDGWRRLREWLAAHGAAA